jgi:uncharacterized protein
MTGQIKFAVDGMLEKLGKYLRALGYDCLFTRGLGGGTIERCLAEGRVLVTARKTIPVDFTGCVVMVEEGPVESQLVKIFNKLETKPAREKVLTICLICNVQTERVPLEAVAEKVPPSVKERISDYRLCPSCGKVYWWGSHADHILQRVIDSGVF